MHRSSESIAALAAALAKAQVLLTNPEKSLTATVGTDRYDEPGRTFRYAPLSSGLDIVRKALGQHEIATVQTTAIDQTAQAISLTTVLAHSSGDWIASDWPVCALSEMATPRRMGAALTYARRYALFTLVGIAGEEDLDAPDLTGLGNGSAPRKTNGTGAPATFRSFSANRKVWSPPKPALEPEKSAVLRDQLLARARKPCLSGRGNRVGAGRARREEHSHDGGCGARTPTADQRPLLDDFANASSGPHRRSRKRVQRQSRSRPPDGLTRCKSGSREWCRRLTLSGRRSTSSIIR
jgi:ERF superfamily